MSNRKNIARYGRQPWEQSSFGTLAFIERSVMRAQQTRSTIAKIVKSVFLVFATITVAAVLLIRFIF